MKFHLNEYIFINVRHFREEIKSDDLCYESQGSIEELEYDIFIDAGGMSALLPYDQFESIYNALYDRILQEVRDRKEYRKKRGI